MKVDIYNCSVSVGMMTRGWVCCLGWLSLGLTKVSGADPRSRICCWTFSLTWTKPNED
ncbi:hypothetical protein Lalb_Chr01g0001351 [Lupinus albus]|uniref:Uncharacterized protein n=1 Tax=Lupinus albus TaxID=3870 RepID=A0A6A4R2Q8_LUPAL|nr:hypothetical protein Lalb_Chr01g0001351 [Lupinus albus]